MGDVKLDMGDEAKLIISNLPSDYTTETLYELFNTYGDISECEAKWGIGFVGFCDAESAELAYQKLNNYKLDGGKNLKIDFPGRKPPVSRLIVKNLPANEFTEEDLKTVFEQFGSISDCLYKWGYGFIKFREETAVQAAIQGLKGYEIGGKKIYFELQGPKGETKKVETAIGSGSGETDVVHPGIGYIRLFCGNVADGTSEDAFRELVEPFGEIKKINVRGNFAFIHFVRPEDCKEALASLDKAKINGNNLRVQLAEIKKGCKLYVGNLKEDQDQQELIEAFTSIGHVVEYKMVKKFAFFTYDDPADAKKALNTMNNSIVGGSRLSVQVSMSERHGHTDPDACHSCGAKGHFSKNCPEKNYSMGRPGVNGHANGRFRSRSPTRRSRDYDHSGAHYPAYEDLGRSYSRR